jgi:imidazolonepropionase-like amidohydrolase
MTTVVPTAQARLTALRAAWLFDGTGAALIPDPVVVIEGGAIRDVCPGGRIPPIPEGGTVVDLPGATLLPGLVDTHVHLAFDASADPVGQLARRRDDEVVAAMAEAGRAALRGGVTTIRDLGDYRYLSLGLRDRADLPTIVAAGPPITTPGGHCHYLGGSAAPTCAGVRAAVREHADRGVDVIKVMASGGNLTPGSRQDLAQFPPEVLRAAADEAHRLGLPVTAHAHAVGAIADAVAAGVCGLGHRKGRVAAGFDADLLAVDGNPVADPEALHRIRAVYARGAAVTAPAG